MITKTAKIFGYNYDGISSTLDAYNSQNIDVDVLKANAAEKAKEGKTGIIPATATGSLIGLGTGALMRSPKAAIALGATGALSGLALAKLDHKTVDRAKSDLRYLGSPSNVTKLKELAKQRYGKVK